MKRSKRKVADVVQRYSSGERAVEVEGQNRTLRFVFSDGSIDRMGDTVDPEGWDINNFMKNPVALWSHDSFSPPIGKASDLAVVDGKLYGNITFADAADYAFADTIYRLCKGGYINACSVGFRPTKYNFSSDPTRQNGIDFEEQELLEISVCPVPANAGALVAARSAGVDINPVLQWAERALSDVIGETQMASIRKAIKDSSDWKCGAARDLSVDESDSWDGAAAETSIFSWAGGDDFDPEKANKGFLAYNAASPKLRGSYKLPFAHVSGGELKASPAGIRAAASRLPQTDIPESVKEAARGVIDHYENENKSLVPTGICGRKADTECGMKNPAECTTHAASKRLKAGRRISAKNMALLHDAIDHHEKATECLKAIINDPVEPNEEEPDDDPDGINTPNAGMDPAQRRMRDVNLIKASLKLTD